MYVIIINVTWESISKKVSGTVEKKKKKKMKLRSEGNAGEGKTELLEQSGCSRAERIKHTWMCLLCVNNKGERL